MYVEYHHGNQFTGETLEICWYRRQCQEAARESTTIEAF